MSSKKLKLLRKEVEELKSSRKKEKTFFEKTSGKVYLYFIHLLLIVFIIIFAYKLFLPNVIINNNVGVKDTVVETIKKMQSGEEVTQYLSDDMTNQYIQDFQQQLGQVNPDQKPKVLEQIKQMGFKGDDLDDKNAIINFMFKQALESKLGGTVEQQTKFSGTDGHTFTSGDDAVAGLEFDIKQQSTDQQNPQQQTSGGKQAFFLMKKGDGGWKIAGIL